MGRKLVAAVAAFAIAGAAWGNELAGEWTLSIDTPRGLQHPKLVITKTEGAYSGVYHSLRGPIPIDAITREGDRFAFPLVITVPIGEIQVRYQGVINGNEMAGEVHNPRGVVPFSGVREP